MAVEGPAERPGGACCEEGFQRVASLGLSRIEVTQGPKGAVFRRSDNDMVEDFNLQKLPCSNEITSDFDIRLGRCRITARMIVCDDDCRSTCHNCQSKNLSGMTEDRIHRATSADAICGEVRLVQAMT